MTPGQEDRPTQSPDPALPLRMSEKTIKHLPKASRECAGRKLAAILGAVINKDASWMPLLSTSSHLRELGCRLKQVTG